MIGFSEKNKIFIVIVLFFIFLLIGSFKLDKLPNYLHQDEMVFTIGAKKIADTGYDLCGNYLPFFPCFSHREELPHQTVTTSFFITALFYKLYPPSSIFDIRIFSVLIGAISGIIFLFFASEILFEIKNRFFYSVLFSAVFYFSTGIFVLQRFGGRYFILSIFLHLLLLFLIYKFHITKKEILLLFIPLVAIPLMLDYQLYRFFAPLYLLFFILVFRRNIYSKYFIGGLIIFISVFLLVFNQTITDKFTYNFYDLGSLNFLKPEIILRYYSLDPFYFNHFLNVSYSYQYGLFPSLSIIFFLFGLVWIIQRIKQNNFFQFITLSFLTYPLAAILTSNSPSDTRIINLIPIYFIICLYGFYILEKLKISLVRKFTYVLLITFLPFIVLFQSLFFIYEYFYVISKQNNCIALEFSNTFDCDSFRFIGHHCNFLGLFDYLKSQKNNFNKIYFDSHLVFIYSYVNFFNNIMNYNIKNYEVINIKPDTGFEKNSIVVISKKCIQTETMEKKYNLIYKISEPNIDDSFFYIFEIN